MLCYVMLCCAVLCCVVLCCTVLCCIVLYCIVLYILYCTVLCFVFDDIDDILETWEKLFNDAVDTHCPWREKRVKRPNQAPWMTKGILEQLRLRDTLLKSARKFKNPDDWELYKRARNESVNMIKTAKYKFYSNCFEEKKNNPRKMWSTIKSLTGNGKSNFMQNDNQVNTETIEQC